MFPPLVFEPYFRPQVWGETRLRRLLGKSLPAGCRIGESWEISAHPHHVSRVAEGLWAGATLTELWSEHRSSLGGEALGSWPRFPLLLKWLDCHEPLSVQVHPNDEDARELLGEPNGKAEAWVVLHAEPGSRIFAGLKAGATRAEFLERLDCGTVADCLHSFEPRAGDCLLIEPGTVHAVGGGVVLAEVQQSSDATFRIFDWNRTTSDGRPRKIHRDESLRCIRWDRGPVTPLRRTSFQPDGPLDVEHLIQCDYFHLHRIHLRAAEWTLGTEPLSLWMIATGTVELRDESTGYDRVFVAGETVLIPAHTGNMSLSSAQSTLLKVTLA